MKRWAVFLQGCWNNKLLYDGLWGPQWFTFISETIFLCTNVAGPCNIISLFAHGHTFQEECFLLCSYWYWRFLKKAIARKPWVCAGGNPRSRMMQIEMDLGAVTTACPLNVTVQLPSQTQARGESRVKGYRLSEWFYSFLRWVMINKDTRLHQWFSLCECWFSILTESFR